MSLDTQRPADGYIATRQTTLFRADATSARAAARLFALRHSAASTVSGQASGHSRSAKASTPRGLSPWQLRLARDLIDEHLDRAVPLQAIAQLCGLSISRFSRAFAHSTGHAPHRWLMRRRIEMAQQLIAGGMLSLAGVAQACGYSDQSHLTRAFVRATGETPGRWREARKG